MRIVIKGRTFSYKYFLDFDEEYGKLSDCRTFHYFKFSHMTSFALHIQCAAICICTSNSSQGSTPLGGMRCSLNIPGHPIIASKNVIMLPSNEMEKTATSDDYNSNHFHDATLICSLIFQKQESREMSHTNLTGLIRKNLKGGTLSLFSL